MDIKSQRGFSLLELSIVLVIIGLLAGSVIAGKYLIRSSEVSSIITEISQYQSIVKTFTEKYKELPGDMSNASSYWPTCDATPANCNDDGDGAINDTLPWFQLSLAEMISPNYPIISAIAVPGTDIPKADVSGDSGYSLTYGFPYGRVDNYFTLSAPLSTGQLAGVVDAGEAKGIDEKIDDGAASYGDVFAINQMDSGGSWQTSGCVDGGDLIAAPSAISWDLDNADSNECIMVFFLD